MAKVLIDIPENMIEMCQWHKDGICELTSIEVGLLVEAVADGTSLPKGHGRLIDADRLVKEERIDLYTNYGVESKVSAISIEMSPTIIEADKEE